MINLIWILHKSPAANTIIYLMLKLTFYTLMMLALSTNANDPFALPSSLRKESIMIKAYYVPVKTILHLIKQGNTGFLSATGKIIADLQNNQLWVEDDNMHLKKVKLFIQKIDQPIRQVLIKAKIILIDDNASKHLGLYFNLFRNENPSLSQVDFPLVELSSQHILDVKLEALEQSGHAIILSTPQLITNNHQTASIESGEEIPYQEKENNGNTSVTFKKAVLRLKVTPTIMPHNKIALSLMVNQDKPSNLLVNGTPAISTEHLSTTVTIQNQQTLILGGIRERNTSNVHTQVPWISNFPFLGTLFKKKRQQSQHKQLLIMLTPIVVHT